MAGLEQLAAQAMSGGNGEEDLEKQIQEAIACPCVGTSSAFPSLNFSIALPPHRRSFLIYILSFMQLIYVMVLVDLPLSVHLVVISVAPMKRKAWIV
jgi:hypothetical protein